MRRTIAIILFVMVTLSFLGAALWGLSTVQESLHLANDGLSHSGVDYLGVYFGAGITLFHTLVCLILCIIHVCVEPRRPLRYISIIIGAVSITVLTLGCLMM